MNQFPKYLIIAGILVVLAGLLLYFFPNAFRWVGRLPGDIRIEKENSGFYFPIVTMLVVSIAATILINVIRKML